MKPVAIITSLCLVLGTAWGTYFPEVSLGGHSSAHACLKNATILDLFSELQQIYEMSEIRESQNMILMETLSSQNSQFSSLLREQFKSTETTTKNFESFISQFTERISILETSFQSTQEMFTSLQSRIETITTEITSITNTISSSSFTSNTDTFSSTSTSSTSITSEQLLFLQQLQEQSQQGLLQIGGGQESVGNAHHFILQENTKPFDRLVKTGVLVELDGEHFYFRSTPLMSWDHASSVCQELGMRMLTLEKKAKTEKIFEYIKNNSRFLLKHFWLGTLRLTRQDGTYDYLWQSMLGPVRENSWDKGKPESSDDDECVEIWGDAENLSWHNIACDDKNGVICEMIL